MRTRREESECRQRVFLIVQNRVGRQIECLNGGFVGDSMCRRTSAVLDTAPQNVGPMTIYMGAWSVRLRVMPF